MKRSTLRPALSLLTAPALHAHAQHLPDPNTDAARASFAAASKSMDEGRYEEAAAASREALRLWPDTAGAPANLGVVLNTPGRFGEAAASFRHALKLRPDYPEAYFHLGYSYLKQQQYEEACGAGLEAVRLDPSNTQAHCNLGVAL